MHTADRKCFFAEFDGTVYCFDTLLQRKLAIDEYGFTAVPSRVMYKTRPPYIIIPHEKCESILKEIKERVSDHE